VSYCVSSNLTYLARPWFDELAAALNESGLTPLRGNETDQRYVPRGPDATQVSASTTQSTEQTSVTTSTVSVNETTTSPPSPGSVSYHHRP